MKFKRSLISEHGSNDNGPVEPDKWSLANDRVQLDATFQMNVTKVLIERKIFRES